ncbi:MAG: acyltransferase [Phenylobacterium sp.]|jgi:peptidoglycan/LPS O-acetylase OafA/YrhL|nr:acyltransferase [Phenylobacterium sp.]MDZ4318816.1 acyltransferase [Phenylobacterium sp.]
MTSGAFIGGPPAMPALTSVRIFLALGVVLFHLQLTWAWPTTDYTGIIERARLGVDMFFVLSGFVLAHVYTRDVETGRYSHRRFLVARLARIYPAHLVILLMMVAIALTATIMGEAFDPANYSMSGLLRTALLVHAWTPTSTPVEWNGPSWSLSAEWGAYLLFPVFAGAGLALRQRPLALIALSGVLFLALDAAYRRFFDDALLHAEFNLGVLRIVPTFLGGVALLHLSRRLVLKPRPAALVTVAMALLLLGLMHVRAPEPLVVAAAGGLILTLALLSKAGADGPMAWPVLMFLGEASYAVYLLHLPLLVLWKNARAVLLGGDSSYVMPMGEAAAFVVAALLGGAILHALFERPARLWIRRRFFPTNLGAAT